MEELQALLSEKTKEAELLEARIEREKFVAEQLRMRLRAAGVHDTSLIPADMKAGPGLRDSKLRELEWLLQYLADSVELSEQVIFDLGGGDNCPIIVNGRQVILQRMASWQVRSAQGQKLSVPVELQEEISRVLRDVRSRKKTVASQARYLAEHWELVAAEVSGEGDSGSEPAIFLVNKDTAQAAVVAKWPVLDFEMPKPAAPAIFNPEAHFAPLAYSAADAHASAEDPLDIDDHVVIFRQRLSLGDRVEVEFQGEWFAGNWKEQMDTRRLCSVTPILQVSSQLLPWRACAQRDQPLHQTQEEQLKMKLKCATGR